MPAAELRVLIHRLIVERSALEPRPTATPDLARSIGAAIETRMRDRALASARPALADRIAGAVLDHRPVREQLSSDGGRRDPLVQGGAEAVTRHPGVLSATVGKGVP